MITFFFFFRGKTFLLLLVSQRGPAGFDLGVLVAQLDKASDYESEDWGFKSLQGYFFIFGTWNPTAPRAPLARSLEDAEYSLPGCPRGLRGQT